MTKIKNILLIGRTGNGKSALANVFLNQNNNFEEIFEEGHNSSTSKTRKISDETFEINGIKYRIIDTIGLGDTKLLESEVLHEIAKVYDKVKDGLNQVFFVISKRFTKEEEEAYNILRTVIFDNRITKYTTIVRTNFPGFQKPEKSEEDKENVKKENPRLAEIINSCRKLIYIDNPPLNDDYDEDEIVTNKKKREASRARLLAFLGTCQEDYIPESIKQIKDRIDSHCTETFKEKSKSEKELKDLKRRLEELEKREDSKVSEIKELKEKIKITEKLITQYEERIQELKERGILELLGKATDRTVKKTADLAEKALQAAIEHRCIIT